ncbi:hypothetical protein BASA61_004979 [Batrachochytrium salamandrivorans]|nr:hypothetical protein BASA61_004979 [Batrachochytrium salamandrivorans]
MYELRGNSGGSVRFANSLVQLFKPDFKPFGNRYLMNEITHNLFVNGKDPNVYPFAKAWKKTKKGNRFTDVFFTNSMESANTIGQAYLRPMGILNDARCFSSCEVFSGSIQGHDAGIIFGEDGQTGGGGAAVLKLDPFLIRVSPTYFKSSHSPRSLPVVLKHTQIHSQLVSPRLFVLVAIRAKPLRILARTGRENGQSRLHFVCEPFEIEIPIGGFSLDIESAGIYEFTVFQADGKTVAAKKRRSRATTKQKFSIPVSTAATTIDDDKYIKISTTGFTFSGLSDSVGLYQSSTTAPGDGWNNLKGPWVIGNGVQYASNVDSSIEAFFAAPIGTKINICIDVALDTKPDCDFLYLSVKSSGGIEDFLIRSKSLDDTKTFNGISGRGITVKGTAPFTTKSEKFSVALKFTSDWSMEFTDVVINSFTVSAA